MLNSKAKSLEFLLKYNKLLNIPKFFIITRDDYLKNINKIKKFNAKNDTILRSSADNEDKYNLSNAGAYESLILKKNTKKENILKKLQNFLKQFKSNKDLIIVQEYIKNVDLSGVIFSSDKNTNAPYFNLSYDISGKTNLVTSGVKNITEKKLVVFKNAKFKKNKFQKLFEIVKFLEKKLNNKRLDIEFAIKNKKVHIFQVRHLPNPQTKKRENLDNELVNISKKIDKLMAAKLDLSGKKTVFSNMSDWNPAEMIGDKPYPLSISLYKELITDNIWAQQRHRYGYKDCSQNVLMFDFLGSPYIDLRTDLNSFLPKDLNKNISEKSINYFIKKLSNKPFLHDKIEFEVIETCYSLRTKKNLSIFLNKREANDYSSKLLNLTNNIIKSNILYEETQLLKNFEKKIEIINNSKNSNIEKIFKYINLTKSLAALPFAGIARCAFISQKILQDLVSEKIINDKFLKNFYNNIFSFTNLLLLEISKIGNNKKKLNNFIKSYGHIRPSTYDISQKSYAENQKLFSNNNKYNKKKIIRPKINYSNINKIFKKNGYSFNAKEFFDFCKISIRERESAKNIYSKGIDFIFKELILLGKEVKIKRDDLSYIDINFIKNAYSKLNHSKLKHELATHIKLNKKGYKKLLSIKLPDLINDKSSIYLFEPNNQKENFITNDEVASKVDLLKLNKKPKLNDKIVLIKSADPGYDFIFNYKINGLITAYGGSNSHMAIRCLELNIPAAIGVGLEKFNEIKKQKFIRLDCKNKKIIY